MVTKCIPSRRRRRRYFRSYHCRLNQIFGLLGALCVYPILSKIESHQSLITPPDLPYGHMLKLFLGGHIGTARGTSQ